MLNLDTHILIYALSDKLSDKEKMSLSREQWSISSIVIWEIAKLSQLNRIEIDLDSPEFALVLSNMHIWPISLDVCRVIKGLDFKGDPADEIIADTSVVHNVPLVTRDRNMKKSKIIPLL
jgi:PIN domain nuclease of toxin-antitoxin system